MKEQTKNILILCIILIFVALAIFLIVIDATSESSKKEEICKEIGKIKGLKFYSQSFGKCGWGEDCWFQCKFIDDNGDIVIKNVD